MPILERVRESMSLADLAEALGGRLVGDGAAEITGVATVEEAGADQLTFLTNKAYRDKARESKAGGILVAEADAKDMPMPCIVLSNPYLAFAQAMALFFQPRAHAPGVHPTAIVHESAELGERVHIGPYVVVGEGARVGAGCVILAHAAIYEGAVLGEDCMLHTHVVVRERVELGNRVIVHNGSVIGADGFGFAPDAEGTWHKILQAGNVVIADDVEIQANSCVDRAAVGSTVIGEGTKLDNLVQVGHGGKIGKHTLLCGQVGLAGSIVVGNHVMMGGQVGSAGHITIEDGCEVAAQAGVMSDLTAGGRYAGTPAQPISAVRSQVMGLVKLGDMRKDLRKLRKRVDELEGHTEA